MKKAILAWAAAIVLLASCTEQKASIPAELNTTKEVLLDKIKGGWAGQTIGCSYGSVTEFNYRGTMIQDNMPIKWEPGYVKHFYDTWPDLYDDIYMDLTFVDVFNRLGLDAPVDSFAMAFATAGYNLWHANQAARYNILHGTMPPASGHWLNNPHADDIDYQIEADFSGLMSPGMPNTASEISDKIGHIMNYGDGWYGGVYVGAMYSLAFISSDIEFIVEEALNVIPKESNYYQCIADVIKWYRQNPNDWKQTWFECERKWAIEKGCPEGVFMPLDIDAVINSAYVVIGLLYGHGDFAKTIDIATRCGQDSDCNPATAGGILGTVLGYSNIPDYWLEPLKEVEERDFKYTTISLADTYEMSFNQALENIQRNGGSVEGDDVTIKCQQPEPVALEQCFQGITPVERRKLNRNINNIGTVSADCSAVVFTGDARCSADYNYVAQIEVSVDGEVAQIVEMPVSYRERRLDIFWDYELTPGNHSFDFKWLNPREDASVNFWELIVYKNE